MNGARFTTVLVGLAVLLGVLATLDVIAPTSTTTPELVAAEPARSGAWTCTVVDAADEPPPRITAVGAPADSAAAAEVVIDQISGGTAERIAPLAPFPGAAAGADLRESFGPQGALLARWRRTAAIVARSWTVAATAGPGGTLAGPCVAVSSARWIVPGLSTAGGAETELVLTNLFDVDASISITLATTLGERAPALLENIVVPRRSVLRVPLNEHAPEERDLGVIVTTRSGRVVAEAVQRFDAAIGGVDGISLVPAVAAPAEVWTIPWMAVGPPPPDDDDLVDVDAATGSTPTTTSDQDVDVTELVRAPDLPGVPAGWLWITNPGDEVAHILVTVHTDAGALLTDLLEVTTVEPRSVARISLDASLPSGVEQVAVTVSSEDGVPIAVSGVTTIAASDVESTSLTVMAGVVGPSPIWVVPAESTAIPRGRYLAISNPAGGDATVDVSLWTSQGIVRPDALAGIVVPSGALRVLDLSAFAEAEFTDASAVVVATQGQVVVGHVGHALDGPLDLLGYPAVPSAVWSGGGLVSDTRLDPGLANDVRRRD